MPIGLGVAPIGIALVARATSRPGSGAVYLSSVAPIEVNFAASKLSMQNLAGQTESLANYEHTIVLVNNWATWCPPCKAEMPTLSAYYDEHYVEGFTIIAVEAGDEVDRISQKSI